MLVVSRDFERKALTQEGFLGGLGKAGVVDISEVKGESNKGTQIVVDKIARIDRAGLFRPRRRADR